MHFLHDGEVPRVVAPDHGPEQCFHSLVPGGRLLAQHCQGQVVANVKQELEGEARVSVKPPPTESTRTPETFLLAALGQKCTQPTFQKGLPPPSIFASPSATFISECKATVTKLKSARVRNTLTSALN